MSGTMDALTQEQRPPIEADMDLAGMTGFLATQTDVTLAYLFGSAARGYMHEESDIDVGVLLETDYVGETLAERQLALTAGLEPYTSREVQVTLLNQATPILCYEVLKPQHLLFERSRDMRIDYEVRCMKRYFDLLPMLAFFDQALHQRIEEDSFGKRRSHRARTLDTARQLFERSARFAGRGV